MNNIYLQNIQEYCSTPFSPPEHPVFSSLKSYIEKNNITFDKIFNNFDYQPLFKIATPISEIRAKLSFANLTHSNKEDFSQLKSVVTTIKHKVNDDFPSFLSSCVILQCLSNHPRNFDECIFDFFQDNKMSFEESFLSLIKAFHIAMNEADGIPINELEMLNKFKKSVNESNYEGMREFIDAMYRGAGFQLPFFIKYINFYLGTNSPEKFIQILETKNNLIDIHVCLKDIPTECLISLLGYTKNHLLLFELIKLLTDKNHIRELSRTQIEHISEYISKFYAKESSSWDAFLKFFFTFPSRTPDLTSVTGLALAKLNPNFFKSFIDFFPRDDRYKEYFTVAFNNFSLRATAIDKKEFIQHSFAKWISYYEENDEFKSDQELNLTSLHEVAAEHILSQGYEWYFNYICDEIQKLKDISSKWIISTTHFQNIVEPSFCKLHMAARLHKYIVFIPPNEGIRDDLKFLASKFHFKHKFNFSKTQANSFEFFNSIFYF